MVKRVPSQVPLTDHHPAADMGDNNQQEQNTLMKRPRQENDQDYTPGSDATFRPRAEWDARSDYNMQLMLLEQQNRKRVMLARQQRDAEKATQEQQRGAMESDQSRATTQGLAGERVNEQRIGRNLALEDYQMRMMLLEQHNKQTLPKARQQHREMAAAVRDGMDVEQSRPIMPGPAGEPMDEEQGARAPPLHDYQMQLMLLEQQSKKRALAERETVMSYAAPFCKFMSDNPTVFHAVDDIKSQFKKAGFQELSERDSWSLKPSGAYFVDRNGSSLIAFTVGAKYEPGNGAAILAGHIDAITAKLKPVSTLPPKAGYLQVAVAPYASGLNKTWWDRDLGIGGRVLVRESSGKIVTKLVKLDWPIARIPTLAEHFGAPAQGPFNLETQAVPIFGLTDDKADSVSESSFNPRSSEISEFRKTQPKALVETISTDLGINPNDIINWELELFDVQPATLGGLKKDFIFAGRIDDKLCSWAAVQALLEDHAAGNDDSGLLKVVGLFDDEEIGSLLRQGARSNFLPSVIERAVGALSDKHTVSSDLIPRTFANSFMVSSDVIHAVNPNFLNVYLENHAPSLNVGVVVSADSNGHMTTDAVSTAILQSCAQKCGSKLQVFQIRNDSRSGGTVGPMLSSATGIRAIDAGIPQLSMHSIRATTGSKDPGLGVKLFKGFLKHFEEVDKEFR